MPLYVYYRVRGDRLGDALRCARHMQARVSERAGVKAELYRREDEGPEANQTWMEVYSEISPGVIAVLAEELGTSGLAGCIDGERHLERFISLQSP
jgi:hypothetical protein